MNQHIQIEGMTCGNCKSSVEQHIENIPGVNSVEVELSTGRVVIEADRHLSTEEVKTALPKKYDVVGHHGAAKSEEATTIPSSSAADGPSKLIQLKPLFMILLYITVASILMHYKDWSWSEMMLDFIGLFYIVFGFFKLLDTKGFAESFAMYDPLAMRMPTYGLIYPWIETSLGLMFLCRYQIDIALWITLIILGMTTIGVAKILLDKKKIRCACLGTTLQLPMTEATLIENIIMMAMAVSMLSQLF